MNKLLLVLAMVLSSIVSIESQRSCSTSDECEEDECCFQRKCNSNGFICELLNREVQLERCDDDFDCASSCCKNGKCQKTMSECVSAPTMNTDFLNECSSSSECYSFTAPCCVNKKCQACTIGEYIHILPISVSSDFVIAHSDSLGMQNLLKRNYIALGAKLCKMRKIY